MSKILLIIAIISWSFVGWTGNNLYHTYVSGFEKSQVDTIITDYSNCINLSLPETSQCLVNYVNTFYNYTDREDTEKSLEDIKLNGGDCYDYSKLYEKLAKSLNYNADTMRIENEIVAHRFAVIWDKELSGYCILDQLNLHCIDFK